MLDLAAPSGESTDFTVSESSVRTKFSFTLLHQHAFSIQRLVGSDIFENDL